MCGDNALELYFIRHSTIKLNKGVCYGQSDVDVADTFENEVEFIKKKIPFYSEMVFYSSPLKRCLLLTKRLSKTQPIIDKRLLELDFGDWELKKWDLIDKKELQKWTDDIKSYKIANGESYKELYTRAIDFFEDITKKNHKKVAIVTHLGIIRSILLYTLKIPLKNSFSFQIDYCGILKIVINQSDDFEPIINIEFVNR